MTGAYGGMTSETGGVASLLETISADFARLEADTKSEENPKSRGCRERKRPMDLHFHLDGLKWIQMAVGI